MAEEKELSAAEIGAKGGKARALALTPEQRSEIARKAVEARWHSEIPKATHSGELKIGDALIPCAVLDNQTRVLTQRGFSVALGRYKNPKKGAIGDLPVFLSPSNLKSYVSDELARSAIPIKFRLPEGSGGMDGNIALGYQADLLPQVCDVYLAAMHDRKLMKSQHHIAEQARILLKGLAGVGITALVDEATGFQNERDRDALQEILNKYLRKEFATWAKSFPVSFYKEIFRLRNWEWMGMKKNRPQCVANYTKDLVYARLAPGILKELEFRNPTEANGRRKSPMYYWLTEDVGHPALAQHLHAVIGLMRASDDWEQFMKLINRSFPKRGDTLQLSLFADDDF
jgi:hypothetical protein